MGKKDNLVAGIMTTLIILIFLLTTYFCLDIFGIIEVPDNLSLVSLINAKTEKVIAVNPIEDLIITEENIDDWINANTKSDVDEEDKEPDNVEEKSNIEYPYINVPEEQPEEVPEITEDNNSAVGKSTTNATNKLYYYQLDMYGKMIYDRMYDNVENLKTGNYEVQFDTLFNELLHQENGESILENAFQFGVNALLFDHPEIFYLDITKMYMSTEITSFGPLKTYKVKIGNLEGESYLSKSFYNKQSIDVVSEMIETIKSNIEGSIIEDTAYNKIKTVHDYLIKNVSYDQTLSKDNIYNIYGALINKEAVCEGYSKAFKYIMDDFGIPCVIACGIGQNSNGETESHAWNYVKIDSNWYAVDCTWDDPVIVGNGRVSDSVYTKYFLKGSDDFFVDHAEDGKIVDGSSFVYPTLSLDNY